MNPVTRFLLPGLAALLALVPLLVLAHRWDIGAWPPPTPPGGPSAATRLRRTWIKVGAFTVLLVALFVWSGDVVTAASGGSSGMPVPSGVTVAAGEQIFWATGKCYTCHSVGARGGKIRGPNLGASASSAPGGSAGAATSNSATTDQPPIAVRAEQIAPIRAAAVGHSMTATDYLVESIVNPSAYLSKGYKDEMPKVYRPPISLTADQVTSVILYLQSLGGTPDPSAIHLPPEIRESATGARSLPEAWRPYLPGDSARGQAFFFDLTGPAACSKCHRVGNQGGKDGPDLSSIGSTSTPQLIVTALLEPASVGTRDSSGQGQRAHQDFARKINLGDFHDLLAFLEKLQPYRADSTGDSARGRVLFFDVAGPAACARCHRLGNRGADWGPDLTTVAGTRTANFIVESVLQPSKALASGYQTVQLVTRTGKGVEGVAFRQNSDSVWVGTSDGTVVAVPAAAIVERRTITTSTMPGDFGKKLSARDLADLVAFLASAH